MTSTWLAIAAIAFGFIGLIWSADRFVAGSAALAHNFGIPKLIVGLTIVAFGTSAPEVVVSVSASLRGAGELAVGNALGSNLANIGLVLAVTALIAPLAIYRHLLVREVPALILITAISGLFLLDSQLHAWEGWLLLILLPLIMALLIWSKRQDPKELEEIPSLGRWAAGFWFLLGLGALVASSELLVWGAEQLALAMGVTPLVVGLTVIAIGTSLPELAASVASALKGHQDIALGNIIGSNLFNLLAVMAIPALIQQPVMDSAVFHRDYFAMALITVILVLAIAIDYHLGRQRPGPQGLARSGHLGRRIGVLLLSAYVGYYIWLFLTV